VAEFPVTDLGFQGCFSTGLDAELNFCLPSISPFHTYPTIIAPNMEVQKLVKEMLMSALPSTP
jgi:hypothetical protein